FLCCAGAGAILFGPGRVGPGNTRGVTGRGIGISAAIGVKPMTTFARPVAGSPVARRAPRPARRGLLVLAAASLVLAAVPRRAGRAGPGSPAGPPPLPPLPPPPPSPGAGPRRPPGPRPRAQARRPRGPRPP